ncbi:MAG: hypothetical protein AABZ60_17455 [Planctomycetota bacterium]
MALRSKQPIEKQKANPVHSQKETAKNSCNLQIKKLRHSEKSTESLTPPETSPIPSKKKPSHSMARSQTKKTKVNSARMIKSTSEVSKKNSLLEESSPPKKHDPKLKSSDSLPLSQKESLKTKVSRPKKPDRSSTTVLPKTTESATPHSKEKESEKEQEPRTEKRKKNSAPLNRIEKQTLAQANPEDSPKKSEKVVTLSEKKSLLQELKESKKKKKISETGGKPARVASEAESKKSKKTSFTTFTNSHYNSSEPLYRKPKRSITDFKSFPTEELFKAYQKRIQDQLQEQQKKQAIFEEAIDSKMPILKKNETIPNFLLSDLSLGIHNLKELQSKKVVLFHWSSWDRKCRESLLNWYKFWTQRKGEFTFVTIAQDQNPLMVQAFRDYYQLYGQECYFLIDRDASIEDYFPIFDLPKVHLVNEFGIICGMLADPLQPLDYLESFLRTRPLEDLPKSIANIPTIRDMKRKMEEAQEETIENKFDLAHGYFLNGKGKVSAAILEEIIELQPDNPKAHFRRGVILWDLGMQEKAMEHLVFARDIAKNNELYKKRIQVLEKPELFYSKEQINYKPPSVSSGSE